MHSKKFYIDNYANPIKLEYSNNETFFGDTTVTIYTDYKISLILTDNCGAVIGDKLLFPKRGDIIIFRPSEIHFGRFPDQRKYKFISFLIPTNFFEMFFTDSKNIISPFLDTNDNKINLIQFPPKGKNKIIEIGEELLTMMTDDNNPQNYDIVIFAKLVEVLDMCNKNYLSQKNVTMQSSVPFIVSETIRKIEDDFPNFMGLGNLAKHCGCSVTYLTQTFRKHTGKSIHNYLTERRLENSRLLLQDGMSVTDSCYQSGFSDCSRFISLFKKHFNITPGKYKK